MDGVAYVQHDGTYRHFKQHTVYEHRPVGLATGILFHACSAYALQCLKKPARVINVPCLQPYHRSYGYMKDCMNVRTSTQLTHIFFAHYSHFTEHMTYKDAGLYMLHVCSVYTFESSA